MKKIYLFLCLIITAISVMGQEAVKPKLACATCKEGQEFPALKSGNVTNSRLTAAITAAPAGQINALLLVADDAYRVSDVQPKLMATGKFNVLDVINQTTPTVATLQNYDAVLVWSNWPINDAIGDTLALYIDGGGGVVSAVFNLFSGWGIEGTRFNTDYLLLTLGGYSRSAFMSDIYDPSHPIMDGVSNVTSPYDYKCSSTTVTPGSVVVAAYDDGIPLVVVKENLGPSNARRADINYFPPDMTSTTDDAALLLANAMVWVSKAGNCPRDIVVNNDLGKCSAVVNYTVTAPEKGSVVQTAGLPSGSEFPVGTTANCFTLTDSLAVETSCCFNVTVKDAEAPVAVCKDGGNSKVLLLWDEDNANTQSLKAAIEAEGYTVTMPAVPEYQWDNTNPPLADFDAVVHLKGTTWTSPMSLTAQNALVDFVTVQGKAFIHSEWDAYEIDDMNAQNAMSEITILQRYSGSTSDLTYTVVSGKESHPVLKDIPTSFTISYVGYSPSNLRSYVSNPAEMLMTDQNGTAAVAIRDFGKGKVVGFNHAGNYAGSTALSNALVQQLYINALNWAAKGVFKLDDTGTVTITPEEIDGGSYDACSNIASMELDKTTFTIADVGEQEVTLTVTDGAGNTSSCTSTITITSSDNEIPNVVANPIEVYLDETGRYVLNQDDIEAIADGTTDNLTPFEDLKLVAYPKIFVCANVGEVIHLRLTVEDADGNKAKQWTTVTVLDTISPVAVCKDLDVYLDENGQAVITPEQLKDSATYDACGVESLALDKFIFGCESLGENAVTLTVTDLSGNVATCTATVTVHDTLPPTPVVVADVQLEVVPGVCETAVTYPEALFTENCGAVLEQIAGLGPDGIFPLGTTTETWVATDAAGNTSEISFNVIITTTNALPTLDAVGNVAVNEDSPVVTVPVTGITYGNDCTPQTITISANADNTDLIASVDVLYTSENPTGSVKLTLAPDKNGTSEITVTVKDSEGAMVSKTFTVTVHPVNDPPFVVHPVPDQVVNASYVLKIPLSPALGIVFDDIDDAVLVFGITEEGGGALPGWATIVGDTLVCTPMIADTGCVNLVLKATDAAGASASDTFAVCVDGYPVSSPLINESAFDVKMFPNPTNDRVYIEVSNAAGINDVSVYSITGKEILRRNFYDNKNISFNMREYVSGMYLVKINVEGKQIVKKLVLDKK